jgi:hypothetical protein
MIDLLGHKAKARANSLDKANEVLIAQIREMDQLVFQMSQQDNWDNMRPYFNTLQNCTTYRMQHESNRIRDVLIPEIKKAYIK